MRGKMLATKTMLVDGLTREYLIHVPKNPNGEAMIVLHGGGQQAKLAARLCRSMINTGTVLVFPQARVMGGAPYWEHPGEERTSDEANDAIFLHQLRMLNSKGKTVLCGFSSGCKLTLWMYANKYTKFTGYACIGQGMEPELLQNPAPQDVPVYYQVGSQDKYYPGGESGRLSFKETVEWLTSGYLYGMLTEERACGDQVGLINSKYPDEGEPGEMVKAIAIRRGGHEVTDCDQWHTYERARNFFRDQGALGDHLIMGAG